MAGLVPYLLLPGTAREALTRYHEIFGGELELHSYAEFGREDGPADAIAHGAVSGLVTLFAADAAEGESSFQLAGGMFALLGTADATTLKAWFAALAEGGEVLDPLQERAWGDRDGQVRDRFGVHWLVGYQG
ncbi:MAG: VOC family protein [Leifsonia xyli]|nr:MAG: VOC family protein [Leifsonia xyli]